MDLRLLPGDLVRRQDVLHPVPNFGTDQRLVQSLVAGATEDHVALVVRVRQHGLDRGQAGSLGVALRCRHRRQAAVDQILPQSRCRVVPGRIRLEGPRHQRGMVGIGLDRRDVAAELVALVDVEISKRRTANGAAGRVLGANATAWARQVAANEEPLLLRADDMPLDVIASLGGSVVEAVGEKRSTWRRWNLTAEAARQTMGNRFATIEDWEAVVGLVVDAAEAASLRLTPSQLASSMSSWGRRVRARPRPCPQSPRRSSPMTSASRPRTPRSGSTARPYRRDVQHRPACHRGRSLPGRHTLPRPHHRPGRRGRGEGATRRGLRPAPVTDRPRRVRAARPRPPRRTRTGRHPPLHEPVGEVRFPRPAACGTDTPKSSTPT